MSMQYTENFIDVKIKKVQMKNFDIDILDQNRDCRYTLEPPRSGGSNEYPQSMFWIQNKKKGITP